MTSQAWDVYGPYRLVNHCWVRINKLRLMDTVFADLRDDVDDVQRSLVEHDGYPADITVRRASRI